jgi:hypothetical protein
MELTFRQMVRQQLSKINSRGGLGDVVECPRPELAPKAWSNDRLNGVAHSFRPAKFRTGQKLSQPQNYTTQQTCRTSNSARP